MRDDNGGGRPRRHLVICGDNPLAYRLATELSGHGGLELTVIVRSLTAYHAPRIGELRRVRLVQAAELTDEAFRRAELETAEALALVDQDDVGNLHAALRAQEVNPKARLVIRFFNMSLGERIESMFPDSKVLSDADTAAPPFVAATLGQVAPSHASLPGRPKRTAYVTLRSGVPAERVICGLAITGGEGPPRRLPENEADADLVLALAEGTLPSPVGPSRPRAMALRRTARSTSAWIRMVANRKLGLATIGLLALLGLGTALFAEVAGYSWPNAVYYTVLDAAGAAQPDGRLGTAEKVIQAMITIVGIAFIPVLTAAVVDALVGSRLAVALGRPHAVSGHVVVVGLGNVGSRVIEQLHAVGEAVVGVERDEGSRGVSWARRRGLPVVVGDASRPDTLRAASVETSRVLLAVTNNDMTNLEAALHARAVNPGVRIVLRLFDDDLAERVQQQPQFGIEASRSVSFLAAPAFAAAMLRRRVLATVPVGRQVLLVAEVSVSTGCELVGELVGQVDQLGLVRGFALQRRGSDQLELPSPPDHLLTAGDRLLVVATRGGLNALMRRADPPRPARVAAAGS